MPRLINRQKQIPGGFLWVEPSTQFSIRPWSSFDSAVQQIIAHRQGNPALTARLHWNTDYNAVSEEFDAFNAAVCVRMGWSGYVNSEGASVELPPPSQPEQQKATKCCGQK